MFNQDTVTLLAKPLDRATVKSRKQGGRDVSYIEGWHAIAEANRIFGFDGWTRETVDIKCVSEKPRDIGQAKNAGWGVTYVCKVRIDVRGVVREGCGSGHGIDRDLGQAHESAIKEAETDAMKRAFMTFGNPFGLALYDKSQADVVERLTKKAARPTYLSMLRELDELTSPRALQEWLNDYADAMKPLPDDWQASLRVVVDCKVEFIRAGKEVPPSSEILSDQWAERQGKSLHNAVQSHEPDDPQEVWTDDKPPEWDSAWDKLGPVKQAGVLCSDPAFWRFRGASNADEAAKDVRAYCNVTSRKDLATNENSGKLWRKLVADYRAWQREPAVTDQVAPRQPDDRADNPAAPAGPTAGAAEDSIERLQRLDKELAEAATHGMLRLQQVWDALGKEDKAALKSALDRRHKIAAKAVEQVG